MYAYTMVLHLTFSPCQVDPWARRYRCTAVSHQLGCRRHRRPATTNPVRQPERCSTTHQPSRSDSVFARHSLAAKRQVHTTCPTLTLCFVVCFGLHHFVDQRHYILAFVYIFYRILGRVVGKNPQCITGKGAPRQRRSLTG